MTHLVIASLVFVGGHNLISGTGARDRMVGRLGERGFLVAFSVFSVASLIWLVLAYRAAPFIAVWMPSAGHRWVTFVLSVTGMTLIVLGAAASLPQSDNSTNSAVARGASAITRHPMVWGGVLWALGHCVTNGDAASLVFFGGLVASGLAGALSQERKKRQRMGDDWPQFAATSSFLPLVALIMGRARLTMSDIGWRPIAATLVVISLILCLHPLIIGVSPLPVLVELNW